LDLRSHCRGFRFIGHRCFLTIQGHLSTPPFDADYG
jgi:hypothetical protein